MWIKCSNPATKKLYRGYMDEPIEFSDNGKAQVTAEIGEKLIEEVNSIEVVSEDTAIYDTDYDTEEVTEDD